MSNKESELSDLMKDMQVTKLDINWWNILYGLDECPFTVYLTKACKFLKAGKCSAPVCYLKFPRGLYFFGRYFCPHNFKKRRTWGP